jgi:two-component system KDP operon response regulator KdpE
LRAIARRLRSDKESEASLFSAGELTVDFARRRVTLSENEIHLTPTEYELLKFMVQHADRVLTHRLLLTKIWGPEYAEDTHTLRVHVANLRDKIEPTPARPRFLHTEPRIGYRFRGE